jgi:hypothetical protein
MREYRELQTQQRAKELRVIAFGLAILVLCIGIALATQMLSSPESETAPTATLPITIAPVTLTAVLVPLPTNTPTPIPTNTPLHVSEAAPSPIPPSDPQADVVSYASLVPVQNAPAGVDIRAASVAPDLQVVLQTTESVPLELSGWAEDQVRLWISLYDPVPDPPTLYAEWLFALDLDGDVGTGRPVGSLRINPDLGIEVAVGVYYDPDNGDYETYFLIWDPAQGSWVDEPANTHFIISESRTLVGLALPLDTLVQSAAQIAGVTVVPEAAKGRAAAIATVEERLVDFYPDRLD